MAIKKLRTKRDDQQWMLDLALNMRGRVQNFERDDAETPTRAHNYRMLPKQWALSIMENMLDFIVIFLHFLHIL